MGIFGTFLGVAIGLLHFDSGEIEASVPPLIDGLTAAFSSSIVGLFGAPTIKLRQILALIYGDDKSTPRKSVNIEDLLSSFGEVATHMKEMKSQSAESLVNW